MKLNTKSSITLTREDMKLLVLLQNRLKARTKVEVVRRGLWLLEEDAESHRLREAYRRASLAVRSATFCELEGLP